MVCAPDVLSLRGEGVAFVFGAFVAAPAGGAKRLVGDSPTGPPSARSRTVSALYVNSLTSPTLGPSPSWTFTFCERHR